MKKWMLLPLLLLGGCGLFWDDPYVTVTTTPLNWCEIHYYNATRDPVQRVKVRINGAGFVESQSGTSRLVSDSFAKNYQDASWEDIEERRFTVDPEHVRTLFQSLVNQGLFDKDKMFASTRYPSPGRFIAVRAAMDNKTFSEPNNLFEDDPELAERLYNIVLEFKPRVIRRKQAGVYAREKPKDKDAAAKDGEAAVGKEAK